MTTATQDEAAKSNTNTSADTKPDTKSADAPKKTSSGWKTASVFLAGCAVGAAGTVGFDWFFRKES